MDRVLLDPDLASALAAAGLDSVDGIVGLAGEATARSTVGPVRVDVAGTTGHFHLKRYHYPGWGRSRGLIGRGTLWGCPPEINEFRALAWLRAHDLPAVRPVAAASRTRGGRLVDHALLTEFVAETKDLAARLRDASDPAGADESVQRRVVTLVARELARMHAAGFVHRDCHARNILVRLDAGSANPRIWFLDCRRGGPPTWRRGPLFDVAALHRDLDGLVSAAMRHEMLVAYAGDDDAAVALERRL